MNSVLLVDQTSIPAACGCISLFVNHHHVGDEFDNESCHLEDLAAQLANALNTTLEKKSVSEKALAMYIAKQRNKLPVLEQQIQEGLDEYDDWVQGYNNDDLLGVLGLRADDTALGLHEALEALSEDEALKLYETEIGLFDLHNDPNTPFETYTVVVAAYTSDIANEHAQMICEEQIPTVKSVAFSATTQASEVTAADYPPQD